MSNKKRIEVGDLVKVFTGGPAPVQGVVDYISRATGDSWVILEQQAGLPVYVQQFDYMVLLEKKQEG